MSDTPCPLCAAPLEHDEVAERINVFGEAEHVHRVCLPLEHRAPAVAVPAAHDEEPLG